MPDWSSIHKPVLVNTIGHCMGVVIFGTLLCFFVLNWRRSREYRAVLPALAAALAMFWNLGSLVSLAAGRTGGLGLDLVMAGSFSALSVLPAVLLHIYLGTRYRAFWIAGYAVSGVAVALHIADVVTRAARLHSAALTVVIVGFGVLTAVSVVLDMSRKKRAAGSRLAAAMGLFLLALSFAHFSVESGAGDGWSREILLHHAGLPLALFVLLQDYRFLLLDAFLRFVINASFAAGAVLGAIGLVRSPELAQRLTRPFDAGVLFVGACLVLTLFVYLRNRMQEFLTRVIFLRANVERALEGLQQLARTQEAETEYLSGSAELIARFFRASRFELRDRCARCAQFSAPVSLVDPSSYGLPAWVHAIVPLRFPAGDARYVLLGARDGGRRYLSEDFAIMLRLTAMVIEHVEQLRGVQMQNLLSQAELKTLQAQIHPHFLFNSLTTLYGTIDRSNTEARLLVLDLANVFRYLLGSERTFIEVAEELTIVRSYLKIEAMRLGAKLTTKIEVDDAALQARIPMLSIQPLVENAVKHGVAARKAPGFVHLRITVQQGTIAVEVSNSGDCEAERLTEGYGVGLTNVRRRVALCYGAQARFEANTGRGVTRVGFVLPLQPANEFAGACLSGS
jgi:two-component system LytT family sensor kinase